jgi:gamma-glutamyltranspeptidase/glutathione hydrolase
MLNRLSIAFAFLIALPAVALAQGVVSSADPRASAAGQEILHEGGSAADAAMAMMLALSVVEPQSSGIGGGGFFVYHDAKTGKPDTIDGREKAPSAATPQRFLKPDGAPMTMREAVPGGLSVGVPGNVRLLEMVHDKWGRLPWATLFAPAIRLAEGGYTVNRTFYGRVNGLAPLWSEFPEIADLYLVDGKAPAIGTTIRNPKLAALLRSIADKGPDAFYKGKNARAIVSAVAHAPRNPTALTKADLAAYRAKERAAVCAPYRQYRICGMGPPSSGATTVLQILGMLERFDMKGLGKDSPTAWHLIAEAMLLAYADRDTYLGDSDFVSVPVKGLLDPAYVAARSKLISPDASLGRYDAGTPPGAEARTAAIPGEVGGTTHFVAVDAHGNVATMTSTVEGPFGSQLVANGMVLNNELTDFSFAPARNGAPVANRVEPGKRPLSAMSPVIVYDAAGRPVFTTGAAGGRTIIMQVLKALIGWIDWGQSAQQAVALPNIFFAGTTITVEDGSMLVPMMPALQQLGHRVAAQPAWGKANDAELTTTGWQGGADPRSEGVALAQ